MNRNAEIEADREAVNRILALLFAFADLADRVSGRSYPVRCLVLWFLRRAQAVARDWVAAASTEDMQSALSACAVLHRNSRAEAMHLAQSFCALAHALRRQLRLEERLARRLMRGEKANRGTVRVHRRMVVTDSLCRLARAMPVALCCLRGLGLEAAPRLDTS